MDSMNGRSASRGWSRSAILVRKTGRLVQRSRPSRASQPHVERDFLNHSVERRLGGIVLRFELLNLALQRLQPVFLIVQLPRVALHQSLFLGASFERLHVFPQPLLIVENLLG